MWFFKKTVSKVEQTIERAMDDLVDIANVELVNELNYKKAAEEATVLAATAKAEWLKAKTFHGKLQRLLNPDATSVS